MTPLSDNERTDYEQVQPKKKRTEPEKSWMNRILRLLVAAILIYALMVYIPLGYVIFKPGLAEDVKPMVKVEQADQAEGEFMLTTIRLSYSNVLTYILALFDSDAEIYPKSSVFREGETREEYTNRQSYVMQNSQSNAVQAAYKQGNIPYDIESEGIVVLQLIEGKPAAEVLQTGDLIIKIDDKPITDATEVVNEIRSKSIGSYVSVTYKRGDKTETASIQVANLAEGTKDAKEPVPGLGFSPANLVSVKPQNEQYLVDIEAGEIGGPSAGLMFALEIYNQLTPGDLTKGYRIAGTGEITPEGEVGVIGGIKHKVAAAHREGAQIFFAPADYHFEKNERSPIRNYSDAVEKAKEIGTNMKIVEVKTLQDAIDFLEKLPEK